MRKSCREVGERRCWWRGGESRLGEGERASAQDLCPEAQGHLPVLGLPNPREG